MYKKRKGLFCLLIVTISLLINTILIAEESGEDPNAYIDPAACIWTDEPHHGFQWYLGDFDGDRMCDIFRSNPSSGRVYVFLSDGTSFENRDPNSWSNEGAKYDPWYTGDFNGDGRDDILRLLTEHGGAEVFLSRKWSTGYSFGNPTVWTTAGYRYGPWYIGDFNGDGKDDIFRRLTQYGGAEVGLSTGSSFAALKTWTTAGYTDGPWYIGDFNGDGKDDILRRASYYGGADVFLSTGTDFEDPNLWSATMMGGRWFVGDFNGDNFDDVFRVFDIFGGADVLLSTGTSFENPTVWTTVSFGHSPWYIGDFNGDGMDDLLRCLDEFGGAEVFLSDGTKFIDCIPDPNGK